MRACVCVKVEGGERWLPRSSSWSNILVHYGSVTDGFFSWSSCCPCLPNDSSLAASTSVSTATTTKKKKMLTCVRRSCPQGTCRQPHEAHEMCSGTRHLVLKQQEDQNRKIEAWKMGLDLVDFNVRPREEISEWKCNTWKEKPLNFSTSSHSWEINGDLTFTTQLMCQMLISWWFQNWTDWWCKIGNIG